jgi:hypothetical protein
LLEENLPYDIKGGPFNLDAIIPMCRPTTVTKRRGAAYTTTVQVPVTKTVTQKGFGKEQPAVTVTESTTVTHKQTVTSIVTKYQPHPDSFGREPIKASRKAKTEDGDDSCIYVGDVSGGYDVLSIAADLVAQVLHTLQYYIDLGKETDLAKAGTAEAFIAGVKLALHVKGIGCGVSDDKDPIVGFPGNQDGDIKASLDSLTKLLDFNPFDKANPVTQLVDTILDVLKQLGIDDFEALRPILNNDDVVKKALHQAGLLTGPIPIESKGDKELREVLHLVGLPGLANLKGLFHRFFKAAGENNFSDNIEDLIAEFKHTPYKGTIAKMDTTNFMDYDETQNLLPGYNSTQIEKSIKEIDPKTAKKKYNELLHDITSSLLNKNKTLDDLIPPFVSLYSRMGGV